MKKIDSYVWHKKTYGKSVEDINEKVHGRGQKLMHLTVT